ncbi:AIPR protein [Snodgrassella alvi]|uniref:AIPR family protein n=1 Tax=Snodgrassella alvi TaxID=1196083 RepID=UPI000A016C82|nr:AIPR family protein [Snodgrassella alvi]ORF08517.1 AIPR protein [Snodgrassella alvi]ORF15461.1 AIPR protein [Snodgrassella alvi]ORF19834.1 AIPR protein [Snodgrassella alvi]ORF22695.1 AIPR protein [Snodgrassella alvi]
MKKMFDIGLNAKLNEFSERFSIKRTETNDSDVFESFGNFVIASNLLEEELENLNVVSTGKSQGIDGIIIIVNNLLIKDLDDLDTFGGKEKLTIKIAFIQSTIQKSFDEQKLRSFTDEAIHFLMGNVSLEPFTSIYNELMHKYLDRLADTPSIYLYFLSGKTTHVISDELLTKEKEKISGRIELSNRCNLKSYFVYQQENLKSEYEKIAKYHSVNINFEHNVQLPEVDDIKISLLSLIKFSELKKLILTYDGYLRDTLFIHNVRNFVGETDVNKDIRTTLKDQTNNKFFPYLNNGLVIMCDDISRHPVKHNEFTLTYPRIINGCQTTNMLYEQYKSDENSINDVYIVAKIIATNHKELRKKIVYAANNQNSIDKDLQSLNDYHEKIEQYYNGMSKNDLLLYFERLRGQHAQVTPPYSKINIETLARVYISTFLKLPNTMKSSALKKIEEHKIKGDVFNFDHDVEDYYYCGVLHYWINHFVANKSILFKSKTMDMHLLMSCHIVLDKVHKTTNDKISYLKNEQNAYNLFTKLTDFLNKKDYLFERRAFYSVPKVTQLLKELGEFEW